MTGSVVNIRFGLVVISGEDSMQYYHAPHRDNPDVAAAMFFIGDAVTFRAPVKGWAEDVVVTGRAFEPETDGFA